MLSLIRIQYNQPRFKKKIQGSQLLNSQERRYSLMMKGRKVFVVGVGMTRFEKPGGRPGFDYTVMVREAVTKCLLDAGLQYNAVEMAVAGYVYGDSTCGQRGLYQMGMTGIPVVNVNNNCSTGSTALFTASKLVQGGVYDCILSVGFEMMERGSLTAKYKDRPSPMDLHVRAMQSTTEGADLNPSTPFAPQLFGNAGREHSNRYGTTSAQYAAVATKNHKHSVNNPYSQFRDEYTCEQVSSSRAVHNPLTLLQCCPTSDGAAAAIIASEEFVIKNKLQSKAIEILAIEMVTDMPTTLESGSCMDIIGCDMSRQAANRAYTRANVGPKDIQVIELHDCFSTNELLTYEALGLCEEGMGGLLVESGQTTYGGQWVVNPSGGLISKGHPLGATGLAQCFELTNQLRSTAGKRQTPGARIALQHNIGLGGACVVAIYRKAYEVDDTPGDIAENDETQAKDIVEEFIQIVDKQLKINNADLIFKRSLRLNLYSRALHEPPTVYYVGNNGAAKQDMNQAGRYMDLSTTLVTMADIIRDSREGLVNEFYDNGMLISNDITETSKKFDSLKDLTKSEKLNHKL